ncbi:MAG: EAL domain-containing protein [Campylobacteraceae bacterium]|nr:EAL domain-containing protein [Campylobacteraceae bacterium]
MKDQHVKISKLIIYSPFVFMIFLILTVTISNVIYNYNEYTHNIDFQAQEQKQFISIGLDKEIVNEVIDRQRKNLITNTQNRTIYGISIMLIAVLLGAIFVYVVFRKLINKSLDSQQALVEAKEKTDEISEALKLANEQLEFQLYTDNLTRLGNRQALEKDISLMEEPKLILLDIDSFKDINEYYGSSVGDYILSEVAYLLRDFVRDKNIKVYRTGADEFALLEDVLLDVERYEELALDLVELLKGKMLDIPSVRKPVELNIAIGFSLDSDDVFEKASMALEEAKKREIDYLCYFRKIERTTLYADQIKWSTFIKEALINDTVLPYYQPIFNAQKQIVKYECLVRILNDREEAITPGLFLSISKKVKKYADIEKTLIEKSFKEISGTDKSISVNLLARDMSDSNISNYVVEKLKEYDVAKQVIFEILEDESIENLDRVEIFIDRVKRMGCRIAIDDFGTGYSNFSYLLKLKPDYIKIDGSLIKNLHQDEKSVAIVSAIIIFAQKLGIKTIAEYVHSENVFNIALALGIDEFQGFYLAEPTAKFR